jgi:hypothetical protein
MLELRELLGLATCTTGKKVLSWAYSSPMSFPRKIFATNVPTLGRVSNSVRISGC